MTERAETGRMVFGEDWSGVFIRGDNAGHFAMLLDFALKELPGDKHSVNRIVLENYVRLLNGEGEEKVQHMKSFEECVKK